MVKAKPPVATVDARMREQDGRHFLEVDVSGQTISIPISDESPNAIKSAFNSLILRIKEGLFQIKLDKVGEDLFSQVANEYLTQLNKEIVEVHKEMDQYGLLAANAKP